MTAATALLRQVHPNFAPDGEPTSQAFFPFPKDRGKLSVYDGDQIGPQASYQHYTTILGHRSVGVWGINCEEVAALGLIAVAEPLQNFVEHAVVDFGGLDDRSCRKLAKKLRSAALQRGCLYHA